MGMCRSMHGAVPFLWSAPPHSGQHGVSGAIVPLNVRMSTSRYLGSAFVPMFLRSFDRTGAPRWTKPSSPLPNQRAPPPLPDRGWRRVVVASIGRAFPSSSPCVAAIDDTGGPACCQVPAFKPTGPSFLWPHRKNARPSFSRKGLRWESWTESILRRQTQIPAILHGAPAIQVALYPDIPVPSEAGVEHPHELLDRDPGPVAALEELYLQSSEEALAPRAAGAASLPRHRPDQAILPADLYPSRPAAMAAAVRADLGMVSLAEPPARAGQGRAGHPGIGRGRYRPAQTSPCSR